MTRFFSLLAIVIFLNSCASGYKKLNPKTTYYASKSFEKNIMLEYKYGSLEKKYKKKATKNGITILAVKITNNSDKDLIFGKDFNLSYDDGSEINIIETGKLFKSLKQSPASYLWYLLLAPVQLYSGTTSTSNGYYTETKPANVFPIGLIAGPGLAGGNMIVASSANKNFKNELMEFEIKGRTIKKGETAYGLIGIYSNSYESINIKYLPVKPIAQIFPSSENKEFLRESLYFCAF